MMAAKRVSSKVVCASHGLFALPTFNTDRDVRSAEDERLHASNEESFLVQVVNSLKITLRQLRFTNFRGFIH